MSLEPKENRRGIILLAHGSRDPEADEEARGLCRILAEARPYWEIAAAYLNREPALSEAVEGLLKRGCGRIEVFPLLVFRGKHAREDIPALIAAEKAKRPELSLVLHPHLTRLTGFPSLLLEAGDAAMEPAH